MRASLAVATLLLAGLLLVPGPGVAGPPGWGVRGGWAGARLAGPFGEEIGGDLHHAFTAGAFARFDVLPALSLEPELAWVTKGGAGDLRVGSAGQYHVDSRISYLEMSLLLRVGLPLWGAGPYLIAGPAPAWRIGDSESKVQWEPSSAVVPTAHAAALIFEDVGTLDDPRWGTSFDLGVVGGVGMRMGTGPVRFAIEGRYTRGLLDIHSSDAVEVRNEVFAVTTAVELR